MGGACAVLAPAFVAVVAGSGPARGPLLRVIPPLSLSPHFSSLRLENDKKITLKKKENRNCTIFENFVLHQRGLCE